MKSINERIQILYDKFYKRHNQNNLNEFVKIFMWCDSRGIKWTVGSMDKEYEFDTIEKLEDFIEQYKANPLLYKNFDDIKKILNEGK